MNKSISFLGAFLILLMATSCKFDWHTSGPESSWLRSSYDMRRSSSYPIPSRKLIDLKELGLILTLRNVGGKMALINVDDSKGSEIITNLAYSEERNMLVAIDERGRIIDSVDGCIFDAILPSNEQPLILVTKYYGSRIEKDPDSDLSELLDWNLRKARFKSPFEMTINHERYIRVSKQVLYTIANGRFREYQSINKPIKGLPLFANLEKSAWTIIEMKGPAKQDSDKLYQLIKRKTHNRNQPNFVPVRVQDYMMNLRSVWLFKMENPDFEISYPTAIGCHPMATDDMTGDGFKEIILGGYSPENSVSINNFTDYGQGYIFALDKEGNLLWRYERTANFPRYRASILRSKRKNERLVIGIAATYFDNFGEIVVIDGKTGVVRAEEEADHSFLGMALFDSDNDGEEEIYTGSSTGEVLHLNKNLGIIDRYPRKETGRKAQMQGSEPRTKRAIAILAANDVNGDGRVEVIGLEAEFSGINFSANGEGMSIYNNDLLIFNSNLALLTRINITHSSRNGSIDINLLAPTMENAIGDINGDGVNEIIVRLCGTLYIFGHPGFGE